MRKKIASILLASLIIASCSWSDIIGMVSPSKDGGINTEVVIGDKEETVKTAIQNQEAESITNVTDSSNFLLILAMLGWFLPSPQELLRIWRNRNAK